MWRLLLSRGGHFSVGWFGRFVEFGGTVPVLLIACPVRPSTAVRNSDSPIDAPMAIGYRWCALGWTGCGVSIAYDFMVAFGEHAKLDLSAFERDSL